MNDDAPTTAGADNYVLGEEIARGGMGFILEAEDTKLKRTVAAKIMVFESGTDDGIQRRFLREAEVLARLAHPNIVPIHDIVWEGGVPLFYTMKRVNGRTLQSVLNDLKMEDTAALRDFTLDRLLLAFRKVCDAVAFAHSMGIIHRDLKPDNVMIGEFGEVLVMDWGLAKGNDEGRMTNDESSAASTFDIRHSSSSGTLVGTVVGTPQYMSPEQARGEVDSLDERSDIFSLGGILYAIATLRPPVEGKTVAEVLERVRAGGIAPPTSYGLSRMPQKQRSTAASAVGSAGVAPASHMTSGGTPAGPTSETHVLREITPLPHVRGGRVPAALSSVVMKALSLEKSARYGDVASFAADVEAFQGGFATAAEEAGTLTQLRLLMLRHKAVTALLAAMLALSVFFVAKLLASERKATRNAGIATANEQRAIAQEKDTERALVTSQLAVADVAFRNVDRDRMVQALDSVPQDLRDQRWDYLSMKRDNSLGALAVPGFENVLAMKAVSNRPGLFALANESGALALFDTQRRAVALKIDTGLRRMTMAVSADGGRIACSAERTSAIRLFRTLDGAEEKTLNVPAAEIIAMTFSDDGSHLLATTRPRPGGTDGEAILLSIADGAVRWKFDGRFENAHFSRDGSLVFLSSFTRRHFIVVNAADGRQTRLANEYVVSTARSLGGGKLALGLYTGEIVIIDTATGLEIRRARLHDGSVTALAWTAGEHLISIGQDGGFESPRAVMRLWETPSFSPRGTFFATGAISQFEFSPSTGHLLLRAHDARPLQIWQIPVDIEAARLSGRRELGRPEQGWSTCFLSDTRLLGRGVFAMELYDVSHPRTPQVVLPTLPYSYAMSASHIPAKLAALASRVDGKPYSIKLYDTASGGLEEKRIIPTDGWAMSMAFDPSARRLLVAFQRRLAVFDVATGASILSVEAATEQAEFLGDGERIAAIVQKKRGAAELLDELTILDAKTGRTLQTVPSALRLNALAVSPDRKRLAIGGDEQVVHILDADTLKEVAHFRAHDRPITALTFHPTQPTLASASSDGSVKLWNYANATLERTFLGISGTPVRMAFSPSGRLLSVEGMAPDGMVFELSE